MIKYLAATLSCCLLTMISIAQARSLPEILQDSLANDPGLAEARANERIAGSRLEQTEAARWPVVTATGGQRVLSTNGDSGKSFTPSIRSTWTLYDFGQNEAEVARDNLKIDYYSNKTAETAEELIYEISTYYLEALKAKMSLDVAQANLQRHHEIKKMLEIIVQYDPGRRSELTQATSRLLKVESDITNYQRSLGLSLLRIARYTAPAVGVNELTDPFSNLSPNELVERYKTTEEDLRSHPSYIAQQKELNSIAAELSVAERSRWPTLDVVGVASTDETSVYLNFDVELFNKAKSPGLDEKRHQITAAQSKLTQIQRNLTERARLAELKMLQDQSRLFITDSQIKELQQVAVDYEDQFSIAKRTLLDVVNAYRELATVDLLKTETQYDLMVAKLDYLSAVGALRDWAGVGQKGLLGGTFLNTTLDDPMPASTGRLLDTTLDDKPTPPKPSTTTQSLSSQFEKSTVQPQPIEVAKPILSEPIEAKKPVQPAAVETAAPKTIKPVSDTEIQLVFPDINDLTKDLRHLPSLESTNN